MFLKSFLYLVLFGDLIAAGNSGHSSGPSSLIPAFFNFTILLIILIKILKPIMSDYFKSHSNGLRNDIESAEIKSKDAELMYKKFKNKIDSLDQEVAEIKKYYDTTVSSFAEQQEKEYQEKVKAISDNTELFSQNYKAELNKKILSRHFDDIKQSVESNFIKNDNETNKIVENLAKA